MALPRLTLRAVTLFAVLILSFAPTAARAAPHTRIVLAPSISGYEPSGDSAPDLTVGNVTSQQVSGTVHLLVVLAAFSDVSPTRTPAQIQQDYFGASHSVAAYYHNVSYGKLTIVGDVTDWHTLPYPESTYGTDCTAIDDTACDGQDASWQIAQDIIPSIKTVNLNNYNYFVFVHSGNGEESSGNKTNVWSVAYLNGVYVRVAGDNGRTLTKFDVVPETEARGSVPLGVYTHEFGHLLSLPDMYDTHTGKSTTGRWELMDAGLWNGEPPGSVPAELSSWSRLRLGWLSPSNVVTFDEGAAQLTTISPLERPPDNNTITSVIINIGDHELYLFEDRQSIGNDAALPDHGIVGYHINEVQYQFSTVEGPARRSAFHLGDLATMNPVRAKVVAAYQNGSYLVGFGTLSETPTEQGSALTISVTPRISVNVVVNNQSWTTDPMSGQVTVVEPYSNSTFDIYVPTTVNLQTGARAQFQAWADGTSTNTRIIQATSNITLTVAYKRQFLVSVASQYSSPNGSGWYDENSKVTVSVESPINGTIGTRYVFDNWTGDYPSTSDPVSFQAIQPVNMTASWKTQYFLNVDADGHGIANGTGWYDDGARVSFGVTSPYNIDQYERYVFVSWSGTNAIGPSVQLVMNQPYSVKAQWKRQLFVNITATGSDGLPMQGNDLNMELDAPNGTTLSSLSPGAVWMDEGVWTVRRVLWLSVDVTPADAMFKPSKYADWVIRPRVFGLVVLVSTMLMRRGVQGAIVSLQLPNGSPYSAATNQTGYVVLVNLPASDYTVNVARDANIVSRNSFYLTEDTTLQVRVFDPIEDVLVIVFVILGVVAMWLIAKPATRSKLRPRKWKNDSPRPGLLENRVCDYILNHKGVISRTAAAKELGISTDTLMSVINGLKKTDSSSDEP